MNLKKIKLPVSIKRILLGIFGLFILLNLVANFHAYKMTHFGSKIKISGTKPEDLKFLEKIKYLIFGVPAVKPYNHFTPVRYDLSFQTEKISSQSGHALELWTITDNTHEKCVLLFHGYKSSKHTMLEETKMFHDFNYDIILTDFRGCGGSDGNVTSVGFYESNDVYDVYSYAKNRKPYAKIVLYGISMGIVAVLKAVGESEMNPDLIIAESPYSSLPHPHLIEQSNIS